MQRLLTAAVGTPLLLAAVFLLPSDFFFAMIILVVEWAALEYVRIARAWAPGAPLRALLALVPLAAVGLAAATSPAAAGPLAVLAAAVAVTMLVAVTVLFGRTPPTEALPAFGAFAFGVPYFALGAVAAYRLQQLDPWLLFLGLALVFLGDTAAYYVGSNFGRHKMSPVVSPNKSWEGAAAGLAAAVLAATAWSAWRLGAVPWELLALAAVTGVAAQLGDLAESLLKRGSGIKDSGRLLPGHGGVLDRIDALLFALPVLLAGVWWLGPERLVP
jgi:phosphatidate cytidylyltransferase